MDDLNLVAIVVAAAASLVVTIVYYVVFGGQLEQAGSAAAAERPPAWMLPVEFLRCLVVAAVVAGLAVNLEIGTWTTALLLALALWLAFPVVLLSGSVIHEKVAPKVAAVHGGDWLLKLLLVAVVVGTWGST